MTIVQFVLFFWNRQIETEGLVWFRVFMLGSIFNVSIPSSMALWMCIPGAFFPLVTQAAMCFIFASLILSCDHFQI